MNKILWITVLIPIFAMAKMVEVKDAEKAIEIYSLFGVADICSDSDKLTLEQRFEIEQIKASYNKIRKQENLNFSPYMHYQASSEIFGIKRGSNPSYNKCMQALKK